MYVRLARLDQLFITTIKKPLLIYYYIPEISLCDEPVDFVLWVHITRAHTATVFRLHRYALPGYCALLAKGLDP